MTIVRRSLAAVVALSMLASCATILYPERKGNTGGIIDVGPLVLDILWFIPGLIPGIVALAVDFSTGAIYVNGKRSGSMQVGPAGEVAVRTPVVERATAVELRLVDADGRVLASDAAVWQPGMTDGALSVSLAEAAAQLPEATRVTALQLELAVEGQAPARMPLEMIRDGLSPSEPLLVPGAMLAVR